MLKAAFLSADVHPLRPSPFNPALLVLRQMKRVKINAGAVSKLQKAFTLGNQNFFRIAENTKSNLGYIVSTEAKNELFGHFALVLKIKLGSMHVIFHHLRNVISNILYRFKY